MARKGLGKCIAVTVGGAVGGSIGGGTLGTSIDAIPGVIGSISTLLAFAIPSVLGLAVGIILGVATWKSTSDCHKQPPDNGGSGSQSSRSEGQTVIIVRERVIVVWAIMFIAVLLPLATKVLIDPLLGQIAQFIFQAIMVAIALSTWAIGIYWLNNQGVVSHKRSQELSKIGTPEKIAQETQPETSLPNETSIKARVYELCEGFLAVQMKGQAAAFRADWKKLKLLPLETLEQLAQTPAASQGLGFAGENQQLLPVVSTISWAVVDWPELSRTKPPVKIITKIAEEAEERGCERALSNALALYLLEHLTAG